MHWCGLTWSFVLCKYRLPLIMHLWFWCAGQQMKQNKVIHTSCYLLSFPVVLTSWNMSIKLVENPLPALVPPFAGVQMEMCSWRLACLFTLVLLRWARCRPQLVLRAEVCALWVCSVCSDEPCYGIDAKSWGLQCYFPLAIFWLFRESYPFLFMLVVHRLPHRA